jgi:simple sugar transport system ATP-binding protein
VPEDRLSEGLFLDKSIRDNIVTTVLDQLKSRFGALDARRAQALAEATVTDLQIATPDVERPVQSLSGGNQQRVLIGRWLAIHPRMLILHGPTVGVDVGSKDIIYRIIERLADAGLAVVLVSDDLPELLQNCDRILLMRKGRIAQQYDVDGLREDTLYQALILDPTAKAVS